MKLDPFKRELLRNALITIADNMMASIVRTSRSTVVKSNLDFSASICDGDGQMVAQGLSLPSHLGATPPALKGCLDYFGDRIFPGDILANNDPYSGASHLNDIFMFRPVFAPNGRRIAFLSIILHHTDLGGRVPGGNATDSTEIFQEGLRLPPVKIYQEGVPNETLLRVIEANTRVPDKVIGDVNAQIASLLLAEKEFARLFEDYAVDELAAYMTDLVDYTERLTRAGLRALPDGEASFTEWNDSDGVGDKPVRIFVTIRKKGDAIEIDFTGTSPQTTGALNPNFWFTASLACAVIRSVLPFDISNNAGFYKPMKVIAPAGCFVNPLFPAPVGARGQAGFRVRSVVLGALSKLLPGRIGACPGGSEFGIAVAGYDPTARPFLFLEFHNTTGHGGGPKRDGQDAGPYSLGNTANTPIEVIEADTPVLVEEYGFLPNTGGPGKFRGCLGMVRQYRILEDGSTVQVRSDRQKFPPWGLNGGKPGWPGRCVLNPHSRPTELPSKFIRIMNKGDVMRAEMPGGGGYGDPFERDGQGVRDDVRQEKMTIGHAEEVYGVVIDSRTGEINRAETARLRNRSTREAAHQAPAAV